MIKLYGIKNCDTIKKTLKWFDANNVAYEFIDYKKHPPDAALATRFIAQHGWETIINKRGTTWRKLDDTTKENMSDTNAIEIIQHQPSMIKRPIVEENDLSVVGYDETQFLKFK